jgi:hypothetical protein
MSQRPRPAAKNAGPSRKGIKRKTAAKPGSPIRNESVPDGRLEDDAGFRCIRAGFGYYTFEVDSYSIFIRDVAPLFVRTSLPFDEGTQMESQEFVWRGMRNPAWMLQSSLSRFASDHIRSTGLAWQRAVSKMTTKHLIEALNQHRGLGLLNREHDELHQLLGRHLGVDHNSFLSVLSAMSPSQINLTRELFSLGQHHGLLTPFLDWTTVPLIALYFAFEQDDERRDGEGFRVVFALNKTAVEKFCPPHEAQGPESIFFLNSMAHDNPRVVAQNGLFTFVPAHLPVDQWVVAKCMTLSTPVTTPILIRFLIRNSKRIQCLQELAASNIHARSVFPDRFGAAQYSNFRMESVGSD